MSNSNKTITTGAGSQFAPMPYTATTNGDHQTHAKLNLHNAKQDHLTEKQQAVAAMISATRPPPVSLHIKNSSNSKSATSQGALHQSSVHSQLPGTPKSQRSHHKEKPSAPSVAPVNSHLMSPKSSSKMHHGTSQQSPGWDDSGKGSAKSAASRSPGAHLKKQTSDSASPQQPQQLTRRPRRQKMSDEQIMSKLS